MPTIPLYHHQSQLRNQARPHANAATFGAAQAQALGQVSAQLSQLGQQLQQSRDYRALTEYQLQQQEFEASEEKWRMANPNADEQDIVKRYELNRKAFDESFLSKNTKGLSRQAKDQLSAISRQGYTRGSLKVTQEARQMGIKRTIAASDTVIKQAIDAGDLDTALTEFDRGIALQIRTPEHRDAFIHSTQQTIQRNTLDRQLAQTLELPPAQAIERINELITSLQNRSEETAALGLKQVNDGLTQAEQLRRTQQTNINTTAQKALDAIATGQADEILLNDLYEQGQIDEQTFEFISGEPYQNAQERYKQVNDDLTEKANQAHLDLERKQYDNFVKLQDGITPTDSSQGKVGLAEVHAAHRFGRIDKAQLNRLIAEIENQTLYDQTTYEYKNILSEILIPRETHLRTDQLQEIAKSIIKAKLSKQAKVDLQRAAFITQQEWLEKEPQIELNGAPAFFKDPSRQTSAIGLYSRSKILEAVKDAYALQANGTAITTLVGADEKIRNLVDRGASTIDINTETLKIIEDIEIANATATLDDAFSLEGDIENSLGL